MENTTTPTKEEILKPALRKTVKGLIYATNSLWRILDDDCEGYFQTMMAYSEDGELSESDSEFYDELQEVSQTILSIAEKLGKRLPEEEMRKIRDEYETDYDAKVASGEW